MTYQSILIPTDGSSDTEQTFEHGLALAERCGAAVDVLYVVDLGYTEEEVPTDSVWTSLYEEAEKEGEAALTDFRDVAAKRYPDVPVTERIRAGHPARTILDEIDQHSHDLVVMGPHRTSRLRRLFVGSTTERVVRSSPVPVLTLRTETEETPTDYENIVIATDGSPGSSRAVQEGVDLAAEYGATVHAIYALDSQYVRSYSIREFMEREGNRALRRVVDIAATAGVDIRDQMLEGYPNEAIVRYADRHDVDLVVVGTHGRTGLDRLVVGSVAAHVIRSAPVPVLTVRTVNDHRLPDQR
ncbi:universal stress protein [Halomarina rubra]|uniref:Universal stress protein n=1 Tax=Halomarina rubra TaxID=2071873 RepID=A0ABD6AV27_9EURY|nr:universal stress protein [Halomarina rubra]